MKREEMSFGELIATKRKAGGISQKELAQLIVKEDGTSIAAQYLNDIEHGRRNPSSDHLIKQFIKHLDIEDKEADYLFFLAGCWPGDVQKFPKENVMKALVAFRKNLAT